MTFYRAWAILEGTRLPCHQRLTYI